MVTLQLYTGVRPSELINLDKENLSIVDKTLTIRDTKTYHDRVILYMICYGDSPTLYRH